MAEVYALLSATVVIFICLFEGDHAMRRAVPVSYKLTYNCSASSEDRAKYTVIQATHKPVNIRPEVDKLTEYCWETTSLRPQLYNYYISAKWE